MKNPLSIKNAAIWMGVSEEEVLRLGRTGVLELAPAGEQGDLRVFEGDVRTWLARQNAPALVLRPRPWSRRAAAASKPMKPTAPDPLDQLRMAFRQGNTASAEALAAGEAAASRSATTETHDLIDQMLQHATPRPAA